MPDASAYMRSPSASISRSTPGFSRERNTTTTMGCPPSEEVLDLAALAEEQRVDFFVRPSLLAGHHGRGLLHQHELAVAPGQVALLVLERVERVSHCVGVDEIRMLPDEVHVVDAGSA